MNLFDLSLRLNGFPIKEAKRRLAEIKNVPQEKYCDYIEKTRWDLVHYHLRENKFFQKFTEAKKIETWQDIPIMTKADLQQPLKQRLSHGFSPKNSYVGKTSGSSGHPFIFARDKFTHAMFWAQMMDRYNWFGIDYNRSLQARFYGIPLDFLGYQKERLKDRLGNRYRFPIFDLSEKKMEQFLAVFKKKKFEYINGYTSSIVLFAKYLETKNIQLKEVCPTLKFCIVTSEMLFEDDKQLIEKIFGIPVLSEYGASELDLIAFTNKNGEFQVNSESLFVEIVNDDNEPVPHGNPGRIIITSLFNRAHPFIRYELGDVGILSEKSTAKNPILEKLIGRTNDVAILFNGKKVPGLTFYYVTKSVIEDDGNVKEFVIKQTTTSAFEITYVAEAEFNSEKIRKIEKALEKYVGGSIDLTCKRVATLKRTPRGKLKQFTSEL